MKRKLMGLAFGGAFLAASLGVFGLVKAETTSEDITPNLNVVRSIEDKDQVNMYKAVIDEKGYQNITLNFDASKKDEVNNGWTLKVYDENKEELYQVSGIKAQFTSANFAFAKGKTVYISVESGIKSSMFMPKGVEYNLNFHTYADSDYETENNNKYIDANEIPTGGAVKGSLLNKDDEDYFVYQIPETGYTKVSFEILDFVPSKILGGWNLEIYDKNKSLIYKEAGITKDVTLPELPLAKGQKIYIRIHPKLAVSTFAPVEVEYKLKVNTVKSGKWEVENNGSFKKANKLSGTKYANIINSSDEDYFTFKAAKTGKYKLSIDTGDNVKHAYKVEVFVNNKSKKAVSKVTMSDKSYTFKVKRGQNVWVRIYGISGNSPIGNKYSLKYKFVKK